MNTESISINIDIIKRNFLVLFLLPNIGSRDDNYIAKKELCHVPSLGQVKHILRYLKTNSFITLIHNVLVIGIDFMRWKRPKKWRRPQKSIPILPKTSSTFKSTESPPASKSFTNICLDPVVVVGDSHARACQCEFGLNIQFSLIHA